MGELTYFSARSGARPATEADIERFRRMANGRKIESSVSGGGSLRAAVERARSSNGVAPTPGDASNAVVVESEAERRLAKLKKQQPRIEKLTIEDEDWFLMRLDWPRTIEVSIRANRLAGGRVDLSTADGWHYLTAALLLVGVVQSDDETDIQPFFTPEQAEEWITEPEAKLLVARLFDRLTDMNPSLLEGLKKGVSLKSPLPNPGDVSSETVSSEPAPE